MRRTRHSAGAPLALIRHKWGEMLDEVGGRERLRAVFLLSAVLGLNSADLGALGSVAPALERSLHIGDLEVGVAASAVSVAAALTTLPIGWLTDRVRRRAPLLAASIVLWSTAMLATGAAPSYPALLGARVFLGAVQATSGPTLAALVGDLFGEGERSRIFGFIHAGELVGAGVGFVIAGEVAALLSWRWSFWVLSVPGFMLAFALWRGLPERARDSDDDVGEPGDGQGDEADDALPRLVKRRHVQADPDRVLDQEPDRLSVRAALSYLLHIPTNMIMIVSLSLGYFFLGGAQTFGVIFFRGHYGLGQAAATAAAATLGIGALAGVLAAGRLSDRMLEGGRLNARVTISAIGYIAAAFLFIVPIVSTNLAIALPVFVLAAAALTAPSAPLDAAVLDVIPPSLWGRAEGLQTALRTLAMAAAPVLFGLSAQLFGGPAAGFGSAAGTGGSGGGASGLEPTFLIMLAPLLFAGIALWLARRSYPTDVASMQASRRSVRKLRRRRGRRRGG
ncbi:MAG: MFS transporter [Solirubrobacteraceae bacterium]